MFLTDDLCSIGEVSLWIHEYTNEGSERHVPRAGAALAGWAVMKPPYAGTVTVVRKANGLCLQIYRPESQTRVMEELS